MQFSSVGEVGGGKAVDGFFEVAAGVARVAAALGIAAEPVKSVHGAAGIGIFAEESGDFVAGVRLTFEIGDPGNAPFGVVGILAGGIGVEHTLIKGDGLGTIELNPIIID